MVVEISGMLDVLVDVRGTGKAVFRNGGSRCLMKYRHIM